VWPACSNTCHSFVFFFFNTIIAYKPHFPFCRQVPAISRFASPTCSDISVGQQSSRVGYYKTIPIQIQLCIFLFCIDQHSTSSRGSLKQRHYLKSAINI
jgi:hypothetical protein